MMMNDDNIESGRWTSWLGGVLRFYNWDDFHTKIGRNSTEASAPGPKKLHISPIMEVFIFYRRPPRTQLETFINSGFM